MGWAIRNDRYRYVEWRPITSKNLRYTFSETVVGVELYDYQTDPNESRNLAEDPDYNKIRSQMVKLFDEVLPHLPARR